MKKIYLLGILQCTFFFLTAQNRESALYYSQTAAGGTALSLSMGGATGAVGGDFSNASTNPGGLALYRKSEIAISPMLMRFSSTGKFYGNAEKDEKYNFSFSNLHMTLHFPKSKNQGNSKWQGSTFAAGFNRQEDLNKQWLIRGVNSDGSIVGAMAEKANGTEPQNLDQFSTQLFWNTYLIDLLPAEKKKYTSIAGMINGGETQRVSLESSGKLSEIDFSYASNYNNRLYLGGSLAIRRVIYSQTITHIERNETDSINTFSYLNYTRNFDDRGNSISIRLGAIYRVADWMRIGLSGLIPMDYSISRTYYSSVESELPGNGNHTASSPIGKYDFKLRQSPSLTSSLAIILGKRGIFSLDYEMMDYSKIRLISKEGYFDNENDRIKIDFRNTGNLRLGLEARFNEDYLRMGYQLISNPLSNSEIDYTNNRYSIGAGHRNEKYFIDFSYVLGSQKYSYSPYDPSLEKTDTGSLKFKRHYVILTLGSRF